MEIALLPLLSNNHRYLLHDSASGRTGAVDPCEALLPAEAFGEIRRRKVDFSLDPISGDGVMKLRYSLTSPFVRKVVILAVETGLDSRIERVATSTSDPASGLAKENPLGKVPSLTLDDDTILFDSPVICEYLDSLHAGAKMIPSAGPARWTALRRQALADGIMDAAILRRLESRRPATEQSAGWIETQRVKVVASLDALEGEAEKLGGGIDIGLITIACALGYLDFRFADEDWRRARPKLARWFDVFAKRPSVQSTTPKDA